MKVAILPWGNVIEDYLDTIGLGVEEFATDVEGGWLFGYVEALASAGAGACIIVVSRNVTAPRRIVNPRSGLVTIALPSPRAYRRLGRMRLTKGIAGYAALPRGALARVLQQEKCTHVIFQEYADQRFDAIVPVARRLGVPIVASFQGGQLEPATMLGRAIRRKSIAGADGLIIASSDEEARVKAIYGDVRVGRIFNPVDPKMWFPEDRTGSRQALGLPETARIAVCHCRIDIRHKGLDYLLAAWRRVVEARPDMDLRLHLIGDGVDRDRLRAMIEAEPVPGLRWVDRFTQDRAEMRRELSAADLHVQASRHEGFAVAPMEAMACGLPTILSRAPGAADLLQAGEASGGLLVPVGDVPALAEQLLALLTDDARRSKMAEAARTHVLAVGATEAVGRQLVDFLAGDGH